MGIIRMSTRPNSCTFASVKGPLSHKCAIRRIVIPMYYRIPDLEPSSDTPEGLGEISPWLADQQNVVRLDTNIAMFTASSLLPSQVVVMFPHSPKVSASPR